MEFGSQGPRLAMIRPLYAAIRPYIYLPLLPWPSPFWDWPIRWPFCRYAVLEWLALTHPRVSMGPAIHEQATYSISRLKWAHTKCFDMMWDNIPAKLCRLVVFKSVYIADTGAEPGQLGCYWSLFCGFSSPRLFWLPSPATLAMNSQSPPNQDPK